MAVVGFDFGTTNSLISAVIGGRVISFLDDAGLPIPSVVCYEGSKTIVGRGAHERLAEAGLGVQGNVVRSPKAQLGRESVFVGGVERNPVDVVRDVIEYVREQALASTQAKNIRDFNIDKVVVTIPVNMTGSRRAALRDAFHMAGISVVQFVHEPLAALYGYLRCSDEYEALLRRYDRQLLLVVDWGGGTLDLTLCRLVDGMLVQLFNDGTEDVGSDEFDDRLKNEILKRARQVRGLGDDIQLQPDAEPRLRHRCELAKIELSLRPRTQVFVRNVYRDLDDPDIDYALSRDELEEIVRHLLKSGLSRIDTLLKQGGYTPASVALCLAVGGMANMPAVRTRLHERFGPERVHISDRSASMISEGSAWVAHDDARLQLAKDVEVLLARNTYVPLIKAGTGMPREGDAFKDDLDLYCADPRDGHAKIQLQCPRKPGRNVFSNELRQSIASFLVDIDSTARPFNERLKMRVEIDHNLILHVETRSLVAKGKGAAEVHDLAFGLALPKASPCTRNTDDTDDPSKRSPSGANGEVVVRSNIADHQNNDYIPGEVFFRYERHQFDPEYGKATNEQRQEHMYYQSCSHCGQLPCICEQLRQRGWRLG